MLLSFAAPRGQRLQRHPVGPTHHRAHSNRISAEPPPKGGVPGRRGKGSVGGGTPRPASRRSTRELGLARGPIDQPRKIEMMNLPTSRIVALGAALALALSFAPAGRAAVIQTLDEQAMTASQFNTLFDPLATTPALNQTYQYAGA